jgi:hypothetical protein
MEKNQDVNVEEKDNNVIDINDKKLNRKQRRYLASKMVKEEKAKQKRVNMLGNTPVTRKEFVGLFQSVQKIRDRLYYIDILTASIEKLLVEKNIITEDEIKESIKAESEKAMKFKEIQDQNGNYEERIKQCLELKIDPNISIIGQQIFNDVELAFDEKIRIATEYKLEMLLKALNENQPA